MWYSETLIIVHKGKDQNGYGSNKKPKNRTKSYKSKYCHTSRKHHCSNYAGLCRDLTCPDSHGYTLNNINHNKTQTGKSVYKVFQIIIL